MIELQSIIFRWRPSDCPTLHIPQFEVPQGESVFISGPSGSGKTTLLNLLGGVVVPEEGKVTIGDQDITALSNQARDTFRVDNIGFIFQQFNLIPFLSILENVTLPGHFSSLRRQNSIERSGSLEADAKRLLAHMDLDLNELEGRAVSLMSTGQQQRVAVARALLGAPRIIIADEPTSALDTDTRMAFLDLLSKEVEAVNATLIFVSHDQSLASRFKRSIPLEDINTAKGHQ
ncbi:MAG: ABC transporter ATP-binding protein [Alphaproteobacteria bacterium]|nr:ABC transporter ATP-binding protein [Alphaproteobacteria bacterium]